MKPQEVLERIDAYINCEGTYDSQDAIILEAKACIEELQKEYDALEKTLGNRIGRIGVLGEQNKRYRDALQAIVEYDVDAPTPMRNIAKQALEDGGENGDS